MFSLLICPRLIHGTNNTSQFDKPKIPYNVNLLCATSKHPKRKILSRGFPSNCFSPEFLTAVSK
ncbi:unnamed protein product [Schistosoma mattheei]|uniref:Uncharacterized protein n=1 Tax=Schistosoma mattheei TaxID=31246 RepID=A0A183P296_9TREM|nr:unnamed protein product [Schistosoma mattheei]